MMTVYLLLSAAALAALLWGLCAGQYPISPDTVFRVLGFHLTGRAPVELGLDERIVLLTRGPRVLLAALCGGGLALAGAAMQGIFRNPLAAPELLGISSGAGFGGALALVLGFSSGALIGAAFAAGLAALVLAAEDLDFLRANLTALSAAIEAGDLVQAARLDFEFHTRIVVISGNRAIADVLHNSAEVMQESQRLPFYQRAARRATCDEHAAIIEALASGEPARAQDAMARHIVQAAQRAGVHFPTGPCSSL